MKPNVFIEYMQKMSYMAFISESEFYEEINDLSSKILNNIHPNKLLYDMGNKRFGEKWAHNHLKNLDSRFKDASADHYDLTFNKIKIEVKASRANSPALNESSKWKRAVPINSNLPFTMNFMHIFLDDPDVFVLVSVWKDSIGYHVMSNSDIANNKHTRSYQTEFQMAITNTNFHEFEKFRVEADDIGKVILSKAEK
ncbi:MAG: hypothetical protein HWN81_18055 [Candidatus Lokiarchaeota archaeon]|nr:hypothetical protein [Candidatus Lokiarchaeota archaeon]